MMPVMIPTRSVRVGSRFLFAAVVISFALSLSGKSNRSNDEEKFSSQSMAAMDKKKELIHQELGTLRAHPWAGEYHYGDGLGVNVHLSLAPKSGFVFTWHGCLGLYDLNYGEVQETDGKIRLIFTHPNDREGFQGIAPELIPILWGRRHYLVPSDGLVEFANEINSGSEPGRNGGSRFLLRAGDESKLVRGLPALPAPYSAYLLNRPIQARISSVTESRLEKSTRTTTVVLDVGSEQGVLEGMEFFLYSPAAVFESARITHVHSSDSEAEIVQFQVDEKVGRPSINWRLSTRMRGN